MQPYGVATEWDFGSSLATSIVALPSFAAFFKQKVHDRKRRHAVHPPCAEEYLRDKADDDSHRQISRESSASAASARNARLPRASATRILARERAYIAPGLQPIRENEDTGERKVGSLTMPQAPARTHDDVDG